MSAARPPLVAVAVVSFALGVGLMIPFESTVTRVGGIVALAVFVACGIAAIADPRFLTEDEGRDD